MKIENKDLPEYIRNQQNDSWQIEILIASGLIYFLFQAPTLIRSYFLEFVQSSELSVEALTLLAGTLILVKALLIGFLFNLLLRTLWLAYLGVNFSFPKGVNYSRLGYSDYFKNKEEQRKNNVDRIITIEKYCSLSFSFSIFMTVMSLGVFFLLFFVEKLLFILSPRLYDSADFGYFIIALFVGLILGFFDFIFFRLLKKSTAVSKWYYPFYRFFSIISFSFLFKKEWQTLLSNVSRWKIHSLSLVYFIVALLLASNDIGTYLNSSAIFSLDLIDQRDLDHSATNKRITRVEYNSLLTPNDKVVYGCIESEIIKGKYMYVFVNYWSYFDEEIKHFSQKNNYNFAPKERLSQKEKELNDIAFQNTLSDFFVVSIDKEVQDSVHWFFNLHPITKEKGFKGYLSIENLPDGPHEISVDYSVFTKADTMTTYRRMVVPFIKE